MSVYLLYLPLRTSKIVSHFRQQLASLLNRLPLVPSHLAITIAKSVIILLLWIPIKFTQFKSIFAHRETPEFLRDQILVLFPS